MIIVGSGQFTFGGISRGSQVAIGGFGLEFYPVCLPD